MTAFAVLGERALEGRFAARQAGGMAPIVGRDQELALLIERWRQAKSGEGQVVLLTGEAGIGKSRITEALIETAMSEPHFLLRYQCSPYRGLRAAGDPAARSCRRLRRGRQRGSPAGRARDTAHQGYRRYPRGRPWWRRSWVSTRRSGTARSC